MCRTSAGADSRCTCIAALGHVENRTAGGSSTCGRSTMQEGLPTQTWTVAGRCTLQTAHPARLLRLETDNATLCAQGGDVPVHRGREGTGQDKLWQPQPGSHWKETLRATPPWQDGIQHAVRTSFQRRITACEPPMPERPGHSSSRCSTWCHLCALIA